MNHWIIRKLFKYSFSFIIITPIFSLMSNKGFLFKRINAYNFKIVTNILVLQPVEGAEFLNIFPPDCSILCFRAQIFPPSACHSIYPLEIGFIGFRMPVISMWEPGLSVCIVLLIQYVYLIWYLRYIDPWVQVHINPHLIFQFYARSLHYMNLSPKTWTISRLRPISKKGNIQSLSKIWLISTV